MRHDHRGDRPGPTFTVHAKNLVSHVVHEMFTKSDCVIVVAT